MTAFKHILIVGMLFAGKSHATGNEWSARGEARAVEPSFALSVTGRAGLVSAPFVTQNFPEVSGFGAALKASAALRVAPSDGVRVNLPVSLSRLDMPAGAQLAETAFGNLELEYEHRAPVADSTRWVLFAALLVPTAEHGSGGALLANRSLALASALTGGEESALWTPGVMGARVAATLDYSLPPFEVRANLQLPLLVRLSAASLPEDAQIHPVGLLPAASARVGYWLASWFVISLRAGLVTEPFRVQDPALGGDRARRVQPMAEPGVHARIGRDFAVDLDAALPVGSSLGGNAWSIGVQCRFER